ncbi:MAG: (Fe-S)-binding protein [Ruminococcaceae bacterium]|nr:(Fe-S)-binding protein [Oscillospiraceae bacterium]
MLVLCVSISVKRRGKNEIVFKKTNSFVLCRGNLFNVYVIWLQRRTIAVRYAMVILDAVHYADACRFCWMCRHLCPVGLKTGREVNTPRAKGLLLSMVERSSAEYTADMAQAMYECMLCDACTNDCATGYEPPLYIREARTQAAVEGLLPVPVQAVLDKIKNTGNIYGMQKPFYGIGNKADVLLYIGEVAACAEPGMVRAYMDLLSKAGVDFMVLDSEPASGTMLGDLIGFVAEVQAQAKNCADTMNSAGAAMVVVLDSYDAFYPALS